MKRFLLDAVATGLDGLSNVIHAVRDAVEWARLSAAMRTASSAPPVRPDTEPARPPEHPNFSVVWPAGDASKGGRFDGQ